MCRRAPDGGHAEAHRIDDTSLADAGRAALPFALTAGQATALDFILGQLRAPAPMMCLLQVPAPPAACNIELIYMCARLRSLRILADRCVHHRHPTAHSRRRACLP